MIFFRKAVKEVHGLLSCAYYYRCSEWRLSKKTDEQWTQQFHTDLYMSGIQEIKAANSDVLK